MEGGGTSVPEFFNSISAIEGRSSDGIELVRLRVISANRQLFQLILSNVICSVIGRKDSSRLLFVS